MATHIMIDLETLGVRPDARVLEIGACTFDPMGSGPIEQFSVGLDVSRQPWGTVDPGTIDFWLKQPDEARLHIAEAKKLDPRAALEEFEAAFSPWGQITGVWSHGPAFDITILQTLYARVGRAVPWNYRHVYDTRTLQLAVQAAGGEAAAYPKGGTAHSGVDDAVNQAVWVQRMFKSLPKAVDPLA
jgi:exodeoxyribonuclease VIII